MADVERPTVVACTGCIGSGKSTVARVLGALGARVLDADAAARTALAPGTPGERAVVERFGVDVVGPDGTIDRPALAAVVFADGRARADLEAIVHPVVRRVLLEGIARAAADAVPVVVLDVPLFVETGGRSRYAVDGVLVVDAPEELVVERLLVTRGMQPADARARLAAQAPRAERLGAADYVILNTGSTKELALMARAAWTWIEQLRGGRS